MPQHRRNRRRWLAGLVCLGACAQVPPDPEVASAGVASSERALLAAIAQTNAAVAKLDGGGPAAAQQPYVPEELQRPVDISAKGDVDAVAQALAERLHYAFASNRTAAMSPVPVAVAATGAPIVNLFRDLGRQAGSRADILVNPDRKTVTVMHHA